MLWWEEEVKGKRVGIALQAAAAPDLVCIDSGCNRLILKRSILSYVLRKRQHDSRLLDGVELV